MVRVCLKDRGGRCIEGQVYDLVKESGARDRQWRRFVEGQNFERGGTDLLKDRGVNRGQRCKLLQTYVVKD